MKKFYIVAEGDWARGMHTRFENYKEAKKAFERAKTCAVWASLSQITITGYFKKNRTEEYLDGFTIKD